MEDILLPDHSDVRLYKERAIFTGTFLGGPLVAAYLAGENFKRLGEPDKIKPTWVIAISATILIFGAIFLVPNMDKIPNYLIPLSYTLITRLLIQKYQGAAIKTHIEDGGETYSIWRAVLAGLVGAIVLVAIIAVLYLIANKGSLE